MPLMFSIFVLNSSRALRTDKFEEFIAPFIESDKLLKSDLTLEIISPFDKFRLLIPSFMSLMDASRFESFTGRFILSITSFNLRLISFIKCLISSFFKDSPAKSYMALSASLMSFLSVSSSLILSEFNLKFSSILFLISDKR